MTDSNSPYEEGDEVTLLSNTFEAPEGMIWNAWEVKDASNQTISVSNNKFTMPASDVTVTAQWVADPNATQYEWVLTDLADLTSSDIFVIVGTISNTNYTMSNNNGSGNAPTASSVTIANERITSIVSDNIKWNLSGNTTEGYTFYPNGSTGTWLYCNTTASSSSNNNMRVGTGDRKVFSFNSNNYLVTNDNYTDRFVCVYASGPDWRGYTSGSTVISFYKRQVVNTDPYITADDVELECDDTEGTIVYVLHNATGNITATTTAAWITSLTPDASTSTIAIVCEANNSNESREATVVLAYGEATKEVTVSQAANPNAALTTMDEIFARATEVGNTATDVTITFNNWVVSGNNDSSHAFVTDGTKGFMIYASGSKSNHGFNAGDILSGTVQCKVQLYNGAAEVTNLTSTTTGLTITTGGNVAVANIAMADLVGINTGALVSYQNLTCSVSTSGNYTNYYLTDGTTQIQAYHTIIGSLENLLENGKTYSITGVFVQNNSTKRILPRSAADIEEVVITTPSITVDPATVSIPVEGAEGTLTVTYENITEIIAEVYFCDAEGAEATYDWITAEINDDNNIEYLVEENDGEARTAYLKVYALDDNTEDVYSNLVTFNQAAYVAPATGDEYALYSGELVEGDYLIVYDGGAMNTTVESDRLQYEAVTATNNVIVTDNAEIVWHIAQSGQYWTIYNADAEAYAASTGAKNKAQMLTDGTDDKALWTVSGTETYEFVNKQNAANNVNANLRKNGTYGFACYATSTGGALLLYKKVVEPETHTLYIPGYSNATNPEGGYYLIASPVTVNPEDVEGDPQGMIDGNFDLYYFDQAEENEWRNYEAQSFNLVPGKGYLYAHDTDVELTLTGTPYSGNGVFPLSYTEDAVFAGWNLIGNPYNYDVTVDKDFYIMNDNGDEIITPEEGMPILPMQGFFVVATAAGQTVTFSKYVAPIVPLGKLVLNLNHNRGTVIDRAIVRFGEGEQLPKFQLFENSTKLYIPQGNSDYAIVRSAAEGEMPVNFKAKENGTYTISVNTENIEMDYLHLIDNMTGTDVDLLQTPSYTFEASTRDYASRFRLVFSAEENGASAGSATFAYFNGNEWVVSNEGDAQLHVIDMTGRIVSTETINGNATVKVNAAPGVYMLRLVNGNDIKTQKVIIK